MLRISYITTPHLSFLFKHKSSYIAKALSIHMYLVIPTYLYIVTYVYSLVYMYVHAYHWCPCVNIHPYLSHRSPNYYRTASNSRLQGNQSDTRNTHGHIADQASLIDQVTTQQCIRLIYIDMVNYIRMQLCTMCKYTRKIKKSQRASSLLHILSL